MPDQDGYSVCSQIKQHPEFGHIPVVLMSGVVNKSVADRAVAVKADELIRKPFQPQELIARVKSLLDPKGAATPPAVERSGPSSALSNLFAPAPVPVAPETLCLRPLQHRNSRIGLAACARRGVHGTATGASTTGRTAIRGSACTLGSDRFRRPKLRIEIAHLDLLVKKLQTELQIERQYNQALETQIRSLTDVE